jgi:parallel beta-helix repeat protein
VCGDCLGLGIEKIYKEFLLLDFMKFGGLFFCFVFASCFVSGVNCESVPVDGCVVVGEVVFESNVYDLPSGISIGANGAVLDCNGSSLVGEGIGDGIYNWKYNNVKIRNCNILNYSNGVRFFYDYYSYHGTSIGYSPWSGSLVGNVFEGNDIGFKCDGHSDRYPSGGHNVSGNVFRDNGKGIFLYGTSSSNIFENDFDGNSGGIEIGNIGVRGVRIFENDFDGNFEYGVYLGGAWDSLVYDNYFSGAGIKYVATNNNRYCLDEVGNVYEDGAEGPNCSCLKFVDGLGVSSNENFCIGDYNLSSGISIGANGVVLDCNGSTLIGQGSGNGIHNLKHDNVEIRNCNVLNYYEGINFYLETGGFWGSHWAYLPDNCLLTGNLLEGNHFGLRIYGYTGDYYDGRMHNVSGNIFRDNWRGIETDSIDSYFYNNKFLLNENNVWDSGENYWNDSFGGNYWDDFDEEMEGCFDFDRDFVCDEAYNIFGYGGGVDYLPLINNSCFGKIDVYVSDSSGNFIEGAYAYFNGETWNLTNEDGFIGFDVEGECGELQNVLVKCSDGERVCDEKSSVIGYDGDADSMKFVCDVCKNDRDVFIGKRDVRFREGGVDLLVHSVGVDGDVDVSLVKSCGGVKSLVGVKNVKIFPWGLSMVSFDEDFSGCEKVDFSVGVLEDEDFSANNFVVDFRVIETLKVYLEVDSGLEVVDSVIEKFVGENVEIVSKSEADVEIYVGEKLYSGNGGYLDSGLIRFEGKREGLPWNGIIDFDGSRVFVFGNGIEGTLAGVRKLVEGRENYLNDRVLRFGMGDVYLDGRDLDALSVYDYLNSEENRKIYMKDGGAFGEVVDLVLRRENFNLAVKRVVTNEGVSLRLKNLNFELSDSFRSFVDSVGRPVVMAGGIFSDLNAWEGEGDGLAFDLARGGKDVWEIEITGGEGSECDGCLDYTYDDLVDSFWPALVGAVQYFSGDVTVDYVGHSNGCRVALSSLGKYQDLGKRDVGIVEGFEVDLEGGPVVGGFVGVGCPVTLNENTQMSDKARVLDNGIAKGDIAMEKIREKRLTHILRQDYGEHISFLGNIFGRSNSKISTNLMDFYKNISIDENTSFSIKNNLFYKVLLFTGTEGYVGGGMGGDGVVPKEDMEWLDEKINNSELYYIDENHGNMIENNNLKLITMEWLDE